MAPPPKGAATEPTTGSDSAATEHTEEPQLVPRMAAVSRADDDTVPGHPGTVSEALLSVLLEALRLELAQKTRAAADAASTSVDSEDVEKALLTICARVNRNVAVDVLLRNNAAKVPLTEAHRKLSEFTLTSGRSSCWRSGCCWCLR